MAVASRAAQAVISCDIGLWLIAQDVIFGWHGALGGAKRSSLPYHSLARWCGSPK